MLATTNIIRNAFKQSTLRSYQQLRFKKGTPKLKSGVYGRKPISTIDEYIEVEQSGELEQLEIEKFRFATLQENSSIFRDPIAEKFVGMVMEGGRLDLAFRLVDDAFYHIKGTQLIRKRKLEEELAKGNDPKKMGLLQEIEEESGEIITDPLFIFRKALENIEPKVIVKPIKRGGATYQVPFPLVSAQREWFARKWLYEATFDRPRPKKRSFHETLRDEVLDAYFQRGQIIKRRDDMHRLADANRAFAHYRWG